MVLPHASWVGSTGHAYDVARTLSRHTHTSTQTLHACHRSTTLRQHSLSMPCEKKTCILSLPKIPCCVERGLYSLVSSIRHLKEKKKETLGNAELAFSGGERGQIFDFVALYLHSPYHTTLDHGRGRGRTGTGRVGPRPNSWICCPPLFFSRHV